MVQRWFHHGDVVSGQMDLYMTNTSITNIDEFSKTCNIINISLKILL